MPNKVYDMLKYITMILLPAIATLYSALAGIWGLPYAEQIVATISALTTFMGVTLMVNSANYRAKKSK